MFKITYMVEDKHLAKAMHSVTGVALNLEVIPITNAVVKNGKVKAENSGIGSYKDQITNYVTKMPKDTVFTSVNVKTFIQQMGGSPSAYNHYIKALKEAKLIKSRARGQFVRLS